jgi:hypothetical protein
MIRALCFGLAVGASIFVAGMMMPQPVSIAVRPLVSSYGDPIRIACRVPPDPSNRWIVLGVDGFTRSIIQLDPDARLMHERTVQEPPCGDQIAFCILLQTQNRETRVNQTFHVSCGAFEP